MGAKVGAIPSAIGGRSIELSHVGMVFPITPTTLKHWKGWFRHIVRDQVAVWMMCSVIGLALPCMLSLEFLRNTPVSDHRVAAMTAQGMAARFPDYAGPIWSFVLFVGFLTLAPCAVYSGDLLARHWTDILWATSPRVKKLAGNQVRLIYYSLLSVYAVWGTITLAVLAPLQIAIVGAVLGNVALGFSAFHTLYVNRTLLPRELRPNLDHAARIDRMWRFLLRHHRDGASGSLIPVSVPVSALRPRFRARRKRGFNPRRKLRQRRPRSPPTTPTPPIPRADRGRLLRKHPRANEER